jgi:hypothetical protein
MLHPAAMYGVGGEIYSGYVVAVHHGGLVDETRELLKKLTDPRALSNGISHNPILRLGTGTRNRGLPLGRPRDERRSKVDTIP